MSLNWKEIELILSELTLNNSQIQKIVQLNLTTLVFHLYHPTSGRFSLCTAFGPQDSRIHRTASKTGPKPHQKTEAQKKLQRFTQFLRAHIQGGRIVKAEHLEHSRIVRFTIKQEDTIYFMYCRLWGTASNCIITNEDNLILEAMFRKPRKKEISGEYINLSCLKTPGIDQDAYTVRPYDTAKFSTFNEFISWYYENRTHDEELSQLQKEAMSVFQHQLLQIQTYEASLSKKLLEVSSFEALKETGDLLAGNLYRVKPRESWISVEDYINNNRIVKIALDPSLSPGENVENYYKRYHKAKGAYEHIHQELLRLQNSRKELKEYQHLLFETDSDINEKMELLKQFLRSRQQQTESLEKKQLSPGLRFTSGMFTILVGRTAKENDELLRKWTRGNDYWLHTRDVPGGYVFIKFIAGKTVPLETILDAGNLALFFSKARASGKAELYQTQVKYLRRAKEGPLGKVLPTHEKNLSIILDQKRVDRLLKGETHE